VLNVTSLRVTLALVASPARVIRHESATARWELAVAQPPQPIRPYVREYVGWFEQTTQPICRRELPSDDVPVILNFGAPYRLFDPADPARWRDVSSFTTGAYDVSQLVGSVGVTAGLQFNLTLLGARLFLGRPLEDMKNRAVDLEDVLGPLGRSLPGRLHDARGWDARFAILDGVITARLRDSVTLPSGVLCAWHRLHASQGRASIGAIVDEVGWSAKHLVSRFRGEFGLTPKVLARVLRFARATRLIQHGRAMSLTDLALACGYYDQAHLTRDVREFAGVTPGQLVASLMPDSGGWLADDPTGGSAR
jgi:AraC-like DNA-binding protein